MPNASRIAGGSLQQRLQTAVGFLRTDAEHIRRDLECLREPAATGRGGGFVGIVDDVVGEFDTLLAEGYIVPHIAGRRPNTTGFPISPAAVYRFNETSNFISAVRPCRLGLVGVYDY